MVANVGSSRWNRIASSFRSKAISTSGLVADRQQHFEFPMSGNVGSVICNLDTVENVGVAVGVTLLSLSVQGLLLRLVYTCQFSGSKPPHLTTIHKCYRQTEIKQVLLSA